MGESKIHNRLKNQAAGRGGQTEVSLPDGKRLDALSPNGVPTEIERGGTTRSIGKAIKRLMQVRSPGVLKVPQKDMNMAAEVARKKRAAGLTISNLSGTQKRHIQAEDVPTFYPSNHVDVLGRRYVAAIMTMSSADSGTLYNAAAAAAPTDPWLHHPPLVSGSCARRSTTGNAPRGAFPVVLRRAQEPETRGG